MIRTWSQRQPTSQRMRADATTRLLFGKRSAKIEFCETTKMDWVKVVGAKGFEPSTSWSRNRVAKILKALSGVAYETKRADLPLSVVAKLYLELLNFWGEPIISWRERLLSKRENS